MKKNKIKCTACGCNYDPARYQGGCPDCATVVLGAVLGKRTSVRTPQEGEALRRKGMLCSTRGMSFQ